MESRISHPSGLATHAQLPTCSAHRLWRQNANQSDSTRRSDCGLPWHRSDHRGRRRRSLYRKPVSGGRRLRRTGQPHQTLQLQPSELTETLLINKKLESNPN